MSLHLFRRFKGLTVTLETADPALQEVYALRYRAYLHEGAIEPRPDGVFVDRYDLTRTAGIVAVRDENDRIVGALRMTVQPPRNAGITGFLSSPEFVVFPDEVAALPGDERPIVSGSRFCIDPECDRRSEIALLILMAQVCATRAVGARWGLASARGSHVAFYRRLLMMEQIAAPRAMPGLTLEYGLMAGDTISQFHTIMARFPADCRGYFKHICPDWVTQARTAFPPISQKRAA